MTGKHPKIRVIPPGELNQPSPSISVSQVKKERVGNTADKKLLHTLLPTYALLTDADKVAVLLKFNECIKKQLDSYNNSSI